MEQDLKDRVGIVTGGAQGIGKAIAIELAGHGARIVVADINLETAQKTADEYLAMVRSSGFEVPDSSVATSSPWWSQPDFGLRERLGWRRSGSGDATEIALAARKPDSDS